MAQLEAQNSALAKNHKMISQDTARDARILGIVKIGEKGAFWKPGKLRKQTILSTVTIVPNYQGSIVLKDKRDANLKQVKA